jgi:hypothetical protein
MNGSARGTALVVLLVGVPLLAARGSARAVLTWLGSAAFLPDGPLTCAEFTYRPGDVSYNISPARLRPLGIKERAERDRQSLRRQVPLAEKCW